MQLNLRLTIIKDDSNLVNLFNKWFKSMVFTINIINQEDQDNISQCLKNIHFQNSVEREKILILLKKIIQTNDSLNQNNSWQYGFNDENERSIELLEKDRIIKQLTQKIDQPNTIEIELKNIKNSLITERAKNDRLVKEKKDLFGEKLLIEEKLEKTKEMLGLARSRLHDQTVKPGIGGGESRSDKLRIDFNNFKMDNFSYASSTICEIWKEKDNELDFRSEVSKIKSILSDRVFIDGMIYFGGNQSEVNTSAASIVNEVSLLNCNLTQSELIAIQTKIKAILLRSKEVDNSDEALVKYVKKSSEIILEDLQKIRIFSPSAKAMEEIKIFVEKGLKIVREIINDPSSGELYTPEENAEFDNNLHETWEEHKSTVKFTICAGYRIPGSVLTKADVVTYIPDSPITSSQDPNETNETNESDLLVNQNSHHNQEKQKYVVVECALFKGKVLKKVYYYKQPIGDDLYKDPGAIELNKDVEFDAYTDSTEMTCKLQDKSNIKSTKWYRATNKLWISAAYIEGIPPESSQSSSNGEDRSGEQH